MSTKSLSSLLLEVGSIVLGVLLALGVSEWQQEREKAEFAATALMNVANELEANQALLQQIHGNNAETIATATAAAEEESEEATEALQFIPGVQVRSNAWEALLSSGAANHIGYELLLELSETYSLQSVYRQTGLQLVETSMNMAAMATVNGTDIDNQQFLRQLNNYFNMMLLMEETLLTDYQTTLATLGNPSEPGR